MDHLAYSLTKFSSKLPSYEAQPCVTVAHDDRQFSSDTEAAYGLFVISHYHSMNRKRKVWSSSTRKRCDERVGSTSTCTASPQLRNQINTVRVRPELARWRFLKHTRYRYTLPRSRSARPFLEFISRRLSLKNGILRVSLETKDACAGFRVKTTDSAL
jgi:hypothetical protein